MKSLFLALGLVVFFSTPLFSQTIKGEVRHHQNNQPLQGVNISMENSTAGTVTDELGFFLLYTGENGNRLRVSHIGFNSKTVDLDTVDTSHPLVIKLQPASVHLNKSIVVTAFRNELVSFETPDAVSVISAKQLENNAPRSMAEALIGATGVWMQKTNHGGGSPFIRGLTGNQTLLLVDGIRLNNATFRYGPNQYFNTIDVFSAERVEVIRGKGSVLYGSDALGGVINVITRSPEYFSGKSRIKSRGRLKYMNKGMERSGLGELSFQSKKVALLGNVGYKNFGDIYAGGNLQFERPSGYDETSVNLHAKAHWENRWQVKSAFQYVIQNDVPRFDQVAQRGYQRYAFDPQIHRLAYARLEHFGEIPLLQKVQFTASHQYSDETRKKQKEASPFFQTEYDKVMTLGLSAEAYSEFEENWKGVTGVEFYSDKVNSGKKEENTENGEITEMRGLYPDNSSMKNLALFTQHSFGFRSFNFNLGGRYNTVSIHSLDQEFGEVKLTPSSLVGNISAQYYFSPLQQIILSAYSAFRAPNINDISSFGAFDYGIEIPSPELSPEKSITIETGYKKSTEQFSMVITAFNTRLNNQIVREKTTFKGSEYLDGERVYTKQNLARSTIRGIEFESQILLNPEFSLINNLTWLHGKNRENGEPMRRIPPVNGKLALQYTRKGLSGEAEFLFAAKQDRLSGGDIDDHRIPEGGTPGWSIINFKTGHSWKNSSVNAVLHNLLNTAYRIHGSGVDGYGRSLRLTFQFSI